MGALKGIKVIDLSRLLPGPYCSMVLADHGAEVIAVEARKYQEDELFFADIYRNKRHMTLNLKTQEGLKIFYQLAEGADVILEGFRPGVTKRLGVDYETVFKVNPAVVYCSISGYGQTGPMSNVAGHDVNYLSRSGVLDLIGEKDGSPVIPAVQLADIAGGLNGVIGILLALQERQSSGVGQYIDISMTDCMLGFLSAPLFLQKKLGQRQRRSSTILSHQYACYNTYETADGRYVALGAVENRFWTNFCHKVGLQEYVPRQYDEDIREEIILKLRSLFLSQPLSYWQQMLEEEDVCFSTVQSLEEVLTDSHFHQRQMVVQQGDTANVEPGIGIPVRLSRTPGGFRSLPEAFGASTRDILAELGYEPETIDSFFATGVV